MSSSKQPLALSLIALALVSGAALPAHAADSFQLSTGADYSSGKFGGADRTDVLVVPISARLRYDAWALRVSLPYVRVNGPADVTVLIDDNGGSGGGSGSGSSGGSGSGSIDDDGGDVTGTVTGRRSVSGIGDAALALTRSFNAIAGSPVYIDVVGRVKFATGRTGDGLGTGTTDYSSGGEVGYVGRAGGLYVAGARRFLGSTATLQRVDGWQYSGGGWVNLGAAVELGAVYSFRQASVSTGTDSRSVELNLGFLLGDAWQTSVFVARGLSDGSPDYAGGLSLSWQYRL